MCIQFGCPGLITMCIPCNLQVPGQWYAVPCAQFHVYAQLSITLGLTAWFSDEHKVLYLFILIQWFILPWMCFWIQSFNYPFGYL
jgi:hypothetical protein